MNDQHITKPKLFRSRWLINRGLQIHFALSCSFLMFLSVISIWTIMNWIQSTYAESWALSNNGPEFMFKANFAVMAVIFADMLAAFMLSIYFSHYVAGPLHNIQQTLQHMIDSGEYKPITLRKHDMLRELAVLINKLVETRLK